VVYIESFEIDSISVSPFTFYQQYDNDDDDIVSNCPVCLEPMDESSTGLLTILCQHTFHCHCLSKWGDGSCPVCRYSQKPVAAMKPSQIIERSIGVENDENECSQCQSKENLWICLLCGHIGCGRYVQAHAYDHYTQTSHFYALEIVTQRVWDYAGDGYVHRLIQNAVDGKLVELPSTTEDSSNASQVQKKTGLSLSFVNTNKIGKSRSHVIGI
jgi:BRCA1-associated protein